MKSLINKHKKTIFFVLIILLIIAGVLDIKYEGLFFQLLPQSVQSYLSEIL